jgi:cellulose synthase/poly-beta-1,6-N-acetylglucosamine synthase-like glycosyltransferase
MKDFPDTEVHRPQRIGVLIPAYNEEPVMDGTIDSLLAAGFNTADIYIVDDRSTDRTAEICRNRGVNIFTVPVNGGKARAQIQALQHFEIMRRYDWIIFLDGDTKINGDFAEVMAKAAAADPSVALFLGQVKSVKNNHLFSASRAFDYTYGQDVAKTGQNNFNVIFVAPGCASMYRTDVLAKLQIDHLTLAEDMDLTMQVHRAGGRVSYLHSAVVHTQDPSTFKDYHKQTLRWYRGFWQVVKKHQVFSFFKKKQRVDWYMIMLSADAVIFNRVLWLGVLLYGLGWGAASTALGIDVGTAAAISLYVAYRTKRLDVIWKFPAYYWINYVNFYAYMRAFIEIIVLRKELLAWNKVKRYSFEDTTTSVTEV